MSFEVYPNGSATVSVPASQSIAVYTVGNDPALVYQDVGYPNIPAAWRLIGTVENEQTVFGPFTPAASIKIEAGANAAQYAVGASPTASSISGYMDLSSQTLTTFPINLSDSTLPASTNAIRGANLNPTRTSGWTSFTGDISTTPAQCYTDYRELHTTGVAEVLGAGCFPFMDSGASCASMFAVQAICEVDAGATVLTAGGAPAVGIFPIFSKLLLNGETFNSGGVAAAMFLSVQSNVTDVSTQDVSAINVENASGTTKSLLHLTNTSSGFTNLFWLPDDGIPAKSTQTNGGTQSGWIKVLIGSATRYIKLWDTAPS